MLSSGTGLLLLGEELLAKAALGTRLSIHTLEAERDSNGLSGTLCSAQALSTQQLQALRHTYEA